MGAQELSILLRGLKASETLDCPISIQQTTMSDLGQGELAYDSAFDVKDPVTGITVKVFESVLNSKRFTDKLFDEVKVFVTPVAIIVVPQRLTPDWNPESGYFEYSLKLRAYHEHLEAVICRALTYRFAARSQNNFHCHPNSGTISRIPVSAAQIVLPDFPLARVNPLCESNATIRLNDETLVTIQILQKDKARFEAKLQRQELAFNLVLVYKSKDISLVYYSWKSDDMRKTTAFKNATSSGAGMVSARQLQNIVTEVLQSTNVEIFKDPLVPNELAAEVSKAFERILSAQKPEQIAIENRERAKAIDDLLLQGTNLNVAQFSPIVQMWEVSSILNQVTDFKAANDQLRNWYHKDTNRDKFNAEVSFGYGPFSAKAGYEKEMTKENIESGYFSDQSEFNNFKSKYTTEKGLVPHITPRGLQLVESSTFEASLQQAESSIGIYPRDKSERIIISGSVLSEKDTKEKLTRLASDTPVGTILPFAAEKVPPGFLACDGREVSRNDFLELFTAIGTSYGAGNGSTTFNLPDFRGMFLRGWSAGSNNDPGKDTRTAMLNGGSTGDHVGSVQKYATALPANTFTIAGTANRIQQSHAHSHYTGWAVRGFETGLIAFGTNLGNDPRWRASDPESAVDTSHSHPVTGNVNGGGDAETRPTNASVQFIIKY